MIKNLLFDLGGVIMDIKRDNCVAAFKELGMKNPDEYLGEYVQAGPFAGIEDGSMNPAQFRDEMRRIIGNENLTDRQIDTAFERFLTGIPVRRLRELEKLHHHYGMYLISNTNPIMWNDEIARWFREDGHDVNYYFDGIVTSFEAKSMKPERKIFMDVVEKYGIKQEETLFFDDSIKNCEAARALGFHAQHVGEGQEFYALLEKYPGIKE